MTPLRAAVELSMRLRGFSPQTHESYLHAIEELARHYRRDPAQLTCEEVQRFLDVLITQRKLCGLGSALKIKDCKPVGTVP